MRRLTGELILTTEADLSPDFRRSYAGYGKAVDTRPQIATARRAPDQAHISIAGGNSAAGRLAKRIRRVSRERQATMRRLQVKIAKLQREHAELILGAWGDGDVLDAATLVELAILEPEYDYRTGKPSKADPRGMDTRALRASLEPWMNAAPLSTAHKASGGWCSVHAMRKWPNCPGCA